MNVYPRLDQLVLVRLIDEYRQDATQPVDAVEVVRSKVDIEVLAPGRISHSSVGVELVSESRLADLRESLRGIAAGHGYPSERYPNRSPVWAEYDRETAAHLHQHMGIVPTDAGSRDVWAHVNGWLVPDLVLWRWWITQPASGAGDPRFGWGPRWFARNQMGRLWWRQEILGELYSHGRLGEDQVTALFERPSLGFNPPLAQAIALRWLTHLDDLTVSAEALMRDATKRLRRALPYQSIYSLAASHLDDAVEQAFSESRAALEADGAR